MIIFVAIEEEGLLLQGMDVEWMVIVAAVVEEGMIVVFITICLLVILIRTVDHQMHFMVHLVEEGEDKDHRILPITVVEDFLPVDGDEEEEWTDLSREVHHNVHRTGVR